MRSTRLLLVLLAAVGGCGDNHTVPIDAAPDMGGIGTQCDDGIDNDGDGLIDYPADPGCAVPNADDETDDCPDGTNCPQCANGRDDDGNGSIDYPNDPGCDSASDNTELTDNPVACGATLMIKQLPPTGTDTGMLDSTSTSMISSPCGGGGGAAAVAYRLSLSQATVLVADTAGSTVDTVLDLRSSDCDDPSSEIACHDDISTTNKTSKITKSLPAGNYFLIVSGADTSAVGNYALNVQRFAGEGGSCSVTPDCGPGLVCRTAMGGTTTVCALPQCADTYDDDGDGFPGYPTDPGCTSLDDNDETDPDPLPACANGLDDDGDGQTDYPADTSCSSASGTSEACNGEQDPILEITSGTTTGTLVGAHDDHNATCDASSSGLDLLFTLRVPQLRSLRMDTNTSSFDTVLSLLTAACTEPSLQCADQGGATTNASLLVRNNVDAGNYVVALDAYSINNTPGPWALHISGVIAPGGSCAPNDTLGGAFVCPATNPCMLVGGAMRCVPSQCGDGMDNDGDGIIDYPDDPGCTSADDVDESDTCGNGPGPGCPECADGIDNDGDGQIDLADTACFLPSSPSEGCITTDGITPIVTAVTAGTTVGAVNDTVAACGASATQTSPDKVHSIELPRMRTITIANANSFDAVVALYDSSCGGTPLRCSDEPENLTLDALPAGTYFYSVDGDGASASGAYTITVSGVIEAGASCEGDLADAGAIVCPPTFQCKGAAGSRTCQRAKCGDGIDNDGDGVADYPNDPGCTSPTDDDEEDTCPAGPGCPACADDIDNDGDGQIDYPNDGTCIAASSNSETCITSENVDALVLPITPGETTTAVNDQSPTCGSSTNTAGDRIYSITVPNMESLSIRNSNNFDAVVALFGASCGPSTIACNDTPEDLGFTNLAAGTYYYLVDGYSSGTGTYNIAVSGTIKPGESCESPLAVSGALTCSSGFACRGAAGSRTCQTAVCNDGVDNDSDGRTDYPNDPGCTSRSDDDETDPATPPACANMLDDDGDTFIDYPMDPQCTSASADSESCKASEGIAPLVLPVTFGSTTGLVNDTAPTCGSSSNSAPDITYSLEIPAGANVRIVKQSDWDAVTAIYRESCATTALTCTDSSPETINLTNATGGTYYYVLDGYSSGNGSYEITISGTLAAGGDCEAPLVDSGALRCPTNYACAGTAGSRTCQLAQCADGMDNDGDGIVDYPFEPGCSSADDNDETDPATPAACSNTLDDDGDSLVDYPADYGCVAAGSDSEVFCAGEPDVHGVVTANPTTGVTTGASNTFGSQTCQSSASGEDVALALQLPVPVTTLVIDLSNSSFDTVLSFRDATCAISLACDDDSGDPSTQSKLTMANVQAGNYAIIIDGWSGSDGSYELNVTGTVAAGTSCTSPLFTTGVLACPSGTTCTGSPAVCQ